VLKKRIIPTLLYRDYGLVKGLRFDSQRHIGSPMQSIKVYEMRGVDELIFVDVAATVAGRGPDFALVDDLADDCFMPLTVGGGVRSVDDVRRLLQVGADKVSIGTSLVTNGSVVDEAVGRFGSQCIVASIDFRRSEGRRPEVWIKSGTEPAAVEPVELAREVEARGAGEILLTSIDRDGTMQGYDLEVLDDVCHAVSVPVICSGGAGSFADMVEALRVGASAVAAAAMFHFTEQTPMEAKHHLQAAGFPARV
jgi:cyclase